MDTLSILGDLTLSHSVPFNVMRAAPFKDSPITTWWSGAERYAFRPRPSSTPLSGHWHQAFPPLTSSSLSAPRTICHGSDETICLGLVHLNVCVIVEAVSGKALESYYAAFYGRRDDRKKWRLDGFSLWPVRRYLVSRNQMFTYDWAPPLCLQWDTRHHWFVLNLYCVCVWESVCFMK